MIVLALLAVFFIAIVWVLFFAGLNIPWTPVTAKRGPAGTYTQDVQTPNGISFKLTSMQSGSETGTVSSGADSHRLLFAKSAAILPESDSDIDQRVAYSLFLDLQDKHQIETICYYPPGTSPKPGEPLPDFLIRIHVDSLVDSGHPLFHRYTANARMTIGDSPAYSSYTDDLTPPAVDLGAQCTHQCTASIQGFESSSSRYETLGKEISKSMADVIGNAFDAQVKDYPVASTPPPAFMPPYQKPVEFPFLKSFDAKMMTSGSRFMTPDITHWRISNQPPDEEFLKRVTSDLEAMGWKVPDHAYHKGDRVFRVFSPDRSQILVIFWPNLGNGYTSAAANDCRIVYTQRMTHEQFSNAINSLLENGVSEHDLAPFMPRLWQVPGPRVEAYFARNPPQTVPGILWRIDHLINNKRTDEARKAILRAYTYCQITESNYLAEIESKGNQIGLSKYPQMPDLATLLPDPNVIMSADLPATRTVGVDQPLILIRQNDAKHVEVQCIRAVPDGYASHVHMLQIRSVLFEPNGQKTSSQTPGNAIGKSFTLFDLSGSSPVTVTSSQIPGTESFELTLK